MHSALNLTVPTVALAKKFCQPPFSLNANFNPFYENAVVHDYLCDIY